MESVPGIFATIDDPRDRMVQHELPTRPCRAAAIRYRRGRQWLWIMACDDGNLWARARMSGTMPCWSTARRG